MPELPEVEVVKQSLDKKIKEKLKQFENLNWIISSAEKLPLDNNKFDFYTISFGLRNTKDINKTLNELKLNKNEHR